MENPNILKGRSDYELMQKDIEKAKKSNDFDKESTRWAYIEHLQKALERIKNEDHGDANQLEQQHKQLLEEALRTAEVAKKAAEDLTEFEKSELEMRKEKE